jgi:phosphatidylinositol alpha-mannosyltransferase
MLAVRRTALPIAATYHTNFTRSRLLSTFRSVCQSLVDRIDANIAVSEICVRAIRPYVAGRFDIIPNGVDCAFFAGGRRQWWAAGRHNVLFVARLEARCGLDRLLRAWRWLDPPGAARLIVLGDGPERPTFEALAAELQVPVRFAGAVRDERPDFYASADLLVCPTTIASFGITLLEGMAAGVPIVASDIDGYREILTNGQEGLLVDTQQPRQLADAMNALFADPERRRMMGEAGRRKASTYDWPLVASRILDVYRGLTVAA